MVPLFRPRWTQMGHVLICLWCLQVTQTGTLTESHHAYTMRLAKTCRSFPQGLQMNVLKERGRLIIVVLFKFYYCWWYGLGHSPNYPGVVFQLWNEGTAISPLAGCCMDHRDRRWGTSLSGDTEWVCMNWCWLWPITIEVILGIRVLILHRGFLSLLLLFLFLLLVSLEAKRVPGQVANTSHSISVFSW